MRKTPTVANEAMSTRPVTGLDLTIRRHKVFKADEQWGVTVGELRTKGYVLIEAESNDYVATLRAPDDYDQQLKTAEKLSESMLTGKAVVKDVITETENEVEDIQDPARDR